MFFSGLCFEIPTAVVWLIGFLVAISRWKLHPRVSAAVLISLGCMLAAAVGQVVGLSFLYSSLQSRSMQTTMFVLGIVGILGSLVRAAGWAAMLTAIFGWRDEPAGPETRSPLQFSIRNLLVLTLAVAVLCGVVRGVVDLLGDSAVFLFGLLDEIPIAICWFYGGWLAWSRRKRHPEVARRVAIAIGLNFGSLLLLVAAFLGMVAVGHPGNLLLGVYFFTGLLAGPISWALLLTAAFSWRAVDDPFRSQPADQPINTPPAEGIS